MSSKSVTGLILLPVLVVAIRALAAPAPIEHLETYRQQGIEQVDVERGRLLWYSMENERSCTSCHGDQPAAAGKHAKTGKAIAPMASSVNPDRYRRAKKIEKWFLRNCKWTFGRECSLQEKADILSWLAGQ